MTISMACIEDFRSLFSGNQSSYGVHIVDPDEKGDGKKRGKNFTKTEMVTDDLYISHLEGKQGLGIIPVNKDGECKFAVLDVDVYDKDHKPLLVAIQSYGMPLVPFRSKSGGLHLYIFFGKPEKVSVIWPILEKLRILLSLDNKTEIFPKQRALRDGEAGNWINLPYFGANASFQCMLDRDLSPIGLEEALGIAKNKRVSLQAMEEFFKTMPLDDAPPCLQSIYTLGHTSHRNNYLMSLATYYKAKLGDDFEFPLAEANNLLDDPMDLDRMMKTVVASQKKRNYSYMCKEEPIASICHKEICKLRKYGIGGSEVSEVQYGDLVQHMSDPPYYTWTINDQKLMFFSEDELADQKSFRAQCLRKIHIFPMRLKEETWTKILNTALANIVVKTVEPGDDMSTGATFMALLTEFLTKRAKAETMAQISVGRVYYEEEANRYLFKARALIVFLQNEKSFRALSEIQVNQKLKELGGGNIRARLTKEGDQARLWYMPKKSLDGYVETASDQVEIDFMEDLKNEPY